MVKKGILYNNKSRFSNILQTIISDIFSMGTYTMSFIEQQALLSWMNFYLHLESHCI